MREPSKSISAHERWNYPAMINEKNLISLTSRNTLWRSIDLPHYQFRTGVKNNHYTVTLHALKKFKLDPSEIVLGTHIKEEIEHWTKVLSSCC